MHKLVLSISYGCHLGFVGLFCSLCFAKVILFRHYFKYLWNIFLVPNFLLIFAKEILNFYLHNENTTYRGNGHHQQCHHPPAMRGIEAMERFYHAIGMPVNIHELIGREITDDEIREMARKCSRNYKATCGQFRVLSADDMEAIYKMAR